MPDLPLLTRVTEALADLLAAVTTANGHHVDVVRVERLTRVPGSYADGVVLLELGAGAAAAKEDTPAGFLAFDQQYTLTAFTIPSDFSEDPIDTQAALVLADLLAALMADRTLGGLAWPGIQPVNYDVLFTDGGAFAGLELTLAVGYRFPETDPFATEE